MIALALRWWPQIVGALAVLMILVGTYRAGVVHERDRQALAAAQQRELRLRVEERLRAETDRLAADLEAARAQRQVVTRTITREVPRYVREPAPACADAGLHAGGFRVLHDAAAAGVVPDPARVADAPAVGAAAAAGTIADNYAACLDWRAQVIGWQQWYRTATEAAP
jgi:hypothetical protein